MKALNTDGRGRVRFSKYGFRFELNPDDPTIITVYDRRDGESKLGTIRLVSAAFRLYHRTDGDDTVKPYRRSSFGFGSNGHMV